MEEKTAVQLKKAVETNCSCKATYVGVELVAETSQGRIVWEGKVHVFALEGSSRAHYCYAWSVPLAGSDKSWIFTVPQSSLILTPCDAVRASIVDFRNAQGA